MVPNGPDEHEKEQPRENANLATCPVTSTTKAPPTKTITSTKECTSMPEATRSVSNEKVCPTSQLNIPEDNLEGKKACKKEIKLETQVKTIKSNEKVNPTSQVHNPEDKQACKKETKLKTKVKKEQHIPRQKRPFGSIRCRSVRQQCIAAMYLYFKCIVLDAHIVYCRGIVRFTFQCNRYGLTEKCPCVPSARYSVMVQSKVSMTLSLGLIHFAPPVDQY